MKTKLKIKMPRNNGNRKSSPTILLPPNNMMMGALKTLPKNKLSCQSLTLMASLKLWKRVQLIKLNRLCENRGI